MRPEFPPATIDAGLFVPDKNPCNFRNAGGVFVSGGLLSATCEPTSSASRRAGDFRISRCAKRRAALIKHAVLGRGIIITYSLVIPAQLSLHQDQRHEDDVCSHPQRAQAKYDGGLGDTAGMTLEHLGGVGRDISGSADAEPQVGSDHRYR